jgi:hypothetical protein
MNQYIITEELLQEAMENTTWGRTNQQKFRDKLTPYQSERDRVLDDLHNWFMNYCEGNEEADLEMAFIKAEFTLRQKLRQAGERCMRGLKKCSKDCDDCPDAYTCSESSK